MFRYTYLLVSTLVGLWDVEVFLHQSPRQLRAQTFSSVFHQFRTIHCMWDWSCSLFKQWTEKGFGRGGVGEWIRTREGMEKVKTKRERKRAKTEIASQAWAVAMTGMGGEQPSCFWTIDFHWRDLFGPQSTYRKRIDASSWSIPSLLMAGHLSDPPDLQTQQV